ncbi:MAG: DUF3025 domain-containing protein, partial [Gammaproteobacteria bacterium]|nr:DUF3025 domain-containing protein [Gammaproteobacteria bacterium]
PYIGMTCQALLIKSDTLITDCINLNLKAIDGAVAQQWRELQIKSTSDLYPFPLLGVPGLYEANKEEHFYDNQEYFRPAKKYTGE